MEKIHMKMLLLDLKARIKRIEIRKAMLPENRPKKNSHRISRAPLRMTRVIQVETVTEGGFDWNEKSQDMSSHLKDESTYLKDKSSYLKDKSSHPSRGTLAWNICLQ